MRNETKLQIAIPWTIAAVILVCTVWEVALLFSESLFPVGVNIQSGWWLCLGSLILSLLFTVKTLNQLGVGMIDKLFWLGVAALPILFLVVGDLL